MQSDSKEKRLNILKLISDANILYITIESIFKYVIDFA